MGCTAFEGLWLSPKNERQLARDFRIRNEAKTGPFGGSMDWNVSHPHAHCNRISAVCTLNTPALYSYPDRNPFACISTLIHAEESKVLLKSPPPFFVGFQFAKSGRTNSSGLISNSNCQLAGACLRFWQLSSYRCSTSRGLHVQGHAPETQTK